MEDAEETAEREAAIAAFKAKGGAVKACPVMLAKGLVATRPGESRFDSYNRFVDLREKLTGLKLAPPPKPKPKKRRYGRSYPSP